MPTMLRSAEPESLRAFLRDEIAALVRIERAMIDDEKDIGDYGVTSLDAVELTGRIEDCFDIEVDPEIFFSLRTISGIVSELAGGPRGHE